MWKELWAGGGGLWGLGWIPLGWEGGGGAIFIYDVEDLNNNTSHTTGAVHDIDRDERGKYGYEGGSGPILGAIGGMGNRGTSTAATSTSRVATKSASDIVEAADGLADYLAIKSTPFSQDCETFLASLGTSGAALKAAAANTMIIDGTSSTYYFADLYMYTPAFNSVHQEVGMMTVSDHLFSHPSTKALAQLNGNLIFINPKLWDGRGFGNWYTFLHELVHNVTGKGDWDLPGGTTAFGDELMKHNCNM
jgi:hypothetical protein